MKTTKSTAGTPRFIVIAIMFLTAAQIVALYEKIIHHSSVKWSVILSPIMLFVVMVFVILFAIFVKSFVKAIIHKSNKKPSK